MKRLFFIFLLFIFSSNFLYAEISDIPSCPSLKPVGTVQIICLTLIKLYQKYISHLRGLNCPSFPSCSNFAFQSITKYGFWGVLMTVDRLYYRENDDMNSACAVILTPSGYRFYDPPENNWIFDKSKWRLREE